MGGALGLADSLVEVLIVGVEEIASVLVRRVAASISNGKSITVDKMTGM